MNQEVATGDLIFGAVVLIIFLIIVLVIGRFVSGLENQRFSKAWQPLVPVINGKIIHDGGGAAISWLTGTYKGKAVQASMIPGRNLYQDESGSRYNYFEVKLVDVPGNQDWRIAYKMPLAGLGKEGWQIQSQNLTLQSRLQQAGVLSTLSRFGRPTVEYKAKQKTLTYSEDISPRWVPDQEQFMDELALLLQLAAITGESLPG
jgi:hypothetical protein